MDPDKSVDSVNGFHAVTTGIFPASAKSAEAEQLCSADSSGGFYVHSTPHE